MKVFYFYFLFHSFLDNCLPNPRRRLTKRTVAARRSAHARARASFAGEKLMRTNRARPARDVLLPERMEKSFACFRGYSFLSTSYLLFSFSSPLARCCFARVQLYPPQPRPSLNSRGNSILRAYSGKHLVSESTKFRTACGWVSYKITV